MILKKYYLFQLGVIEGKTAILEVTTDEDSR